MPQVSTSRLNVLRARAEFFRTLADTIDKQATDITLPVIKDGFAILGAMAVERGIVTKVTAISIGDTSITW